VENRIEGYIDSSLEDLAPILYMFSIIGGILLLIIGLFLVVKNNNTQNKKKYIIGIGCFGIGFLALVSGIIQSV